MAATFELEITTPERAFFKEPVEMVVLPGEDGEQGILANHARMVLVVKAGTVRIQREGRWDECVIADVYAMVDKQRVLLLCQRAEWPDEIDERLAREELGYVKQGEIKFVAEESDAQDGQTQHDADDN